MYIFKFQIICNESQHDQLNAVFTDFSIQETYSIIIEKGFVILYRISHRLYPQSLILLLRYLNSSLLEFNEEMKEQFVDQVYFPLQEEIVNWIKVCEMKEILNVQSTIPTDIHAINKWKNQLQEVLISIIMYNCIDFTNRTMCFELSVYWRGTESN